MDRKTYLSFLLFIWWRSISNNNLYAQIVFYS